MADTEEKPTLTPAKMLMTGDDFSLDDEITWLLKHPQFAERPATLREFLGPEYLNIDSGVRDSIREVLAELLGEEVNPDRPTEFELAIFTGGIGIGKTTLAAILLPYLVHWCLCLKDPQGYFGLLPGSRIAFMLMSTSATQAKEVLFGDIKARLSYSAWFGKYPWDKSFKNQLRFDKDIWIVPGDSSETTFEGYNILGGILDEADSHKITKAKDYAQQGYETIFNRMSSRFEDRGFLLIIGQMKKSVGFVSRKYEEFEANPACHATRLTIWESRGDAFYADEKNEVHKFWYDVARKQIVPEIAVKSMGVTENLLHIPAIYKEQFKTNPEKALKDLAGIPPAVTDPFITLTHRIFACRDRWVESNGPTGPITVEGRIEPWFRAPNTIKRVAHMDLAYSGDGDAAGIAMGHISEMIEMDGELKPYIVIDVLYRVRAGSGQEIFLGDLRRFIYSLRDDLGFKLELVTMDGFQSKDTEQQLQRKRFSTDYVSVDRKVLPYHDLREAIYENRIEFPPYMVNLVPGQPEQVEILIKELTELMDTGAKIDHPTNGSKDVADALAGVTTTLVGHRRYHRKVRSSSDFMIGAGGSQPPSHPAMSGSITHPAFNGGTSNGMPLPPRFNGS